MGLFSDLFTGIHASAKRAADKRIEKKAEEKKTEKEMELFTMCGNCSPLDFTAVSVRNLRDRSFLTPEQKQILHMPTDFVLFSGVNSVPAIRAAVAEVPKGTPLFYFGPETYQYAALGVTPLKAVSTNKFVVADIDMVDPFLSAEVVVCGRELTDDDMQKIYRNHSAAVLLPGSSSVSETLMNHTAVYAVGDGVKRIEQKAY